MPKMTLQGTPAKSAELILRSAKKHPGPTKTTFVLWLLNIVKNRKNKGFIRLL